MKATIMTLLLAATSLCAVAATKPTSKSADKLEGYRYDKLFAPDGSEWQDPQQLSLNKEQPRAYLFPFASAEDALSVLPNEKAYYLSLDGTWKFHWAPAPDSRNAALANPAYDDKAWDDIQVPGCWNVQGLGKHGEMKYGVPIYVNQPVIFQHEVKKDDWRFGVMRQPKDSKWTTFKHPNEVGFYRRKFSVPASFKGRHVYVNFDGVDSFFYLWVNGQYVGFSKNSRNTARFDITSYLSKDGENTIALEVYRSSDASFLEAQDMFRLPGIIRSTYLTAMPETQIRDLNVRTETIGEEESTVSIDVNLNNLGSKKTAPMNLTYTVYPVKLYSDETELIMKRYVCSGIALDRFANSNINTKLTFQEPKLWSAESPNRYVLVAELTDKKGRVIDCTSTYFGVRKVEIHDTPAAEDEFHLAGRYFYVNDHPVKLKGVNRHETNPTTGHAISREQMTEEVMLMKRGNINHVRLSHYSNDPYFYMLADKYGLYLEDECNLESHEYYYGEASLSHPMEWRAAHVARNMEMVKAHINHPSIVIWSLGNEAGPGDNFKAAYDAIRAFDTSRPVQYERNNDIVDMGSNQYPSVDWVRYAVKGTNKGIKYPYHISEYAHSMGNSLGNLVDYWEAMESTNYFCGAAIWDWVDQAIDTYTKDGTKYMGYGGDHGDWPNDGMFCMNGIMLPDLTPKPQYFEVKKVYQNVGVKLGKVDDDGTAHLTVFNKNYFSTLRDYDMIFMLVRNGRVIQEIPGADLSRLSPRRSTEVSVQLDIARAGEYFLDVEFQLRNDQPWAKKGYVQMAEQLPLPGGAKNKPEMKAIVTDSLEIVQEGSATVVRGQNFVANFEDSDGSLNCLQYNGKYIIESGNGPKLDAFRAPVDNDNWADRQWFQNGLYDLQHTALCAPIIVKEESGCVSIIYTVRSQAKNKGTAMRRPGKAGQPYDFIETGASMTPNDFHFTTTQRYTVYPDGSIQVAASIISSDADLVLPRLGYAMQLPERYSHYTYYGRGPLNNYADRKTGSFIGLYKSTVKEQFVNFPKPQSMGNREEVRWCALTDGDGNGVQFVSDNADGMSASALPWSAVEMTFAAHPHELPKSSGTHLHLDVQVTGLGGNSCGQGGPLDQDRVKGALHQMKYIIRPVTESSDLSVRGYVGTDRSCPVSISRDKAGRVTIQGDRTVSTPTPICYQVTEPGMEQPGEVVTTSDSAPTLSLRNGGTVTAWYQGDEAVTATATFERIENVPVEVVYVSSEEGPGGEVAKNLTDGDPNTIWHTMYSITVPKYPHWVDFDCGEEKVIKGFTYLPRQDGGANGNIKAYKVQLSMDGKTWLDPVAEGAFGGDSKEKKVLFAAPQRARYLRFTALSSQNGADFASGAEFTVLAE